MIICTSVQGPGVRRPFYLCRTRIGFSAFGFLVLHSPQILNGLLLSKDFEQGEITNSLHPQKREVRQNDPGNEFEGDIFAQTVPIPRWCALDQTLL